MICKLKKYSALAYLLAGRMLMNTKELQCMMMSRKRIMFLQIYVTNRILHLEPISTFNQLRFEVSELTV